jgi:hypothetical protein
MAILSYSANPNNSSNPSRNPDPNSNPNPNSNLTLTLTQTHDPTCASKYCGKTGQCSELPKCPKGQFLDYLRLLSGLPFLACDLCSAGRFGDSEGLTDSGCSGTCVEGKP